MGKTIVFACEGHEQEIELHDQGGSETLRQLLEWLPTTVTVHCAKIAGCHIYWPAPFLAPLEQGTDIHALEPGSLLYYPDRQYIEITYDRLQPESATVNHLGQVRGSVDWIRDFATRHREAYGRVATFATLRVKDAPTEALLVDAPMVSEDTGSVREILHRMRARRLAVWQDEPDEVIQLLTRSGHNIPFGPLATADGYFRFVQESLWQLWNQPTRFSPEVNRAVATNAIELGIARVDGYCHLTDSGDFLRMALAALDDSDVPLLELLEETILYCSRLSNWIDLHMPWYRANEILRTDLVRSVASRA